MQKLPVGIQDFSKLRRGDYLYVDKTREIYRLASQDGYYFLSRPRRFGKSLLVSTLKELFSGNKELFKGLWIEDQWEWEKTNPIIHIPFASLDYKINGLYTELQKYIQEVARSHGIALQDDSLKNQFEELLRKLAQAKGRVVLLIDEYDKPIIDFLGKEMARAQENQQILKNFYSVIKDSDPYLRLVFITGVSKFSRVSIFSDLNNLDDLSLQDYRSNTLLGYTQEELEHYFSDHIIFTAQKLQLAKQELIEKIQRWYNGYSWNGLDFVYNPFSVLNFFTKSFFMNYWFKTATPTFLVELIRKEVFYDFDSIKVGDTAFDSFNIEHIDIITLLFQTGHLTIKKYDAERELYTLGYPNREVKKSMLEYLVQAFSNTSATQVRSYALDVVEALQAEDLQRVKEVFNTLLYSLPYQLHRDEESFYHAIIHLFFKYMGLDVHSEVSTARGRADAIVELDDKVYCFEFKLNKSAKEALEQVKEKGYLDKYRHSSKKPIAVGVNFSTEKREVDMLLSEAL